MPKIAKIESVVKNALRIPKRCEKVSFIDSFENLPPRLRNRDDLKDKTNVRGVIVLAPPNEPKHYYQTVNKSQYKYKQRLVYNYVAWNDYKAILSKEGACKGGRKTKKYDLL